MVQGRFIATFFVLKIISASDVLDTEFVWRRVPLGQDKFGAGCFRGKRIGSNREQAPKVIRLGLLWHRVA